MKVTENPGLLYDNPKSRISDLITFLDTLSERTPKGRTIPTATAIEAGFRSLLSRGTETEFAAQTLKNLSTLLPAPDNSVENRMFMLLLLAALPKSLTPTEALPCAQILSRFSMLSPSALLTSRSLKAALIHCLPSAENLPPLGSQIEALVSAVIEYKLKNEPPSQDWLKLAVSLCDKDFSSSAYPIAEEISQILRLFFDMRSLDTNHLILFSARARITFASKLAPSLQAHYESFLDAPDDDFEQFSQKKLSEAPYCKLIFGRSQIDCDHRALIQACQLVHSINLAASSLNRKPSP